MVDNKRSSEHGSNSAPVESFEQAVYRVTRQIPRGKVVSYGEVARMAGYPGYARHVSKAFNQAPKDLELPWHRVINAQGKISFPVEHDNYQTQKQRLQDEGVTVIGNKISLQQFGWDGVESVMAAEQFFR